MENYARLDSNQSEEVSFPNTQRSSNGAMNSGNSRIRLRAVESEKELLFKLINVTLLRRLITIQAAFSALIVVLELILYSAVNSRNWKPVEITGIGLWAPLYFFFIASGLTYMAIKEPTGCLLGSAMGFQIGSTVIGSVLALFGALSFQMHGNVTYVRSKTTDDEHDDLEYQYDAEVPELIACSSVVVSAIVIIVTSFCISIQLCKSVCCGRFKTAQSVLFDVESNKL